ncbi:MAG: FHA domain-containing protein [Clostridiales bacterium]|nr:FHA domain-containing protein [Clostridiales bacterium]
MFEIFSSLLKYIFITIIYLFIFSVIRMIYLDIHSINSSRSSGTANLPYLKLVNRRDSLGIKVEESYFIKDGLTLGRSIGNGIIIADPYLSSRHVSFILQDGGCLIRDLDSTNGTLVNGEKLTDLPRRLKDGDRIGMGKLDFLFVEGREVY